MTTGGRYSLSPDFHSNIIKHRLCASFERANLTGQLHMDIPLPEMSYRTDLLQQEIEPHYKPVV